MQFLTLYSLAHALRASGLQRLRYLKLLIKLQFTVQTLFRDARSSFYTIRQRRNRLYAIGEKQRLVA